VGRDRYAYAIAATLLLVLAGAAAYRGRSRVAALAGIGAAALALLPIAFTSIYDTLRRGYQSALEGHADDQVVFLGWSREPEMPTPSSSWYGPVGLIAFLTAALLLVRAVRRTELRKSALVLTFAPVLMLVIVAAGWSYSPWHGRFLMPAVALSTATWGVLHRLRALGWALSAIALVTLLLSFLHYREKPAGISVLDGTTSRSVWTASRETVIHTWPTELTDERLVRRSLGSRMKDGETVALRITGDDVSYPYFDAGLERRVVFVDDKGGWTPTSTGSSWLRSWTSTLPIGLATGDPGRWLGCLPAGRSLPRRERRLVGSERRGRGRRPREALAGALARCHPEPGAQRRVRQQSLDRSA
jgi:hypothetical protein